VLDGEVTQDQSIFKPHAGGAHGDPGVYAMARARPTTSTRGASRTVRGAQPPELDSNVWEDRL
jgi:hypothetical protein